MRCRYVSVQYRVCRDLYHTCGRSDGDQAFTIARIFGIENSANRFRILSYV